MTAIAPSTSSAQQNFQSSSTSNKSFNFPWRRALPVLTLLAGRVSASATAPSTRLSPGCALDNTPCCDTVFRKLTSEKMPEMIDDWQTALCDKKMEGDTVSEKNLDLYLQATPRYTRSNGIVIQFKSGAISQQAVNQLSKKIGVELSIVKILPNNRLILAPKSARTLDNAAAQTLIENMLQSSLVKSAEPNPSTLLFGSQIHSRKLPGTTNMPDKLGENSLVEESLFDLASATKVGNDCTVKQSEFGRGVDFADGVESVGVIAAKDIVAYDNSTLQQVGFQDKSQIGVDATVLTSNFGALTIIDENAHVENVSVGDQCYVSEGSNAHIPGQRLNFLGKMLVKDARIDFTQIPTADFDAISEVSADGTERTFFQHAQFEKNYSGRIVILTAPIEAAEATPAPTIGEIPIPDYLKDTVYPNDTFYPVQWYLHNPDTGVHADKAWQYATGKGVKIAVIGNGVLPHEDLSNGQILPGADVVDGWLQEDGDGHDHDATDTSCFGQPLPFGFGHDSAVSGIIAATQNNGIGTSGVAPDSEIVPVRAYNCWNFASEIAEGIRWAAGLDVPGLTNNPNPVDVINLSLGSVQLSTFGCPSYLQEAIDEATAKNIIVVASAGNYIPSSEYIWPANCENVITVGATSYEGGREPWTSSGKNVDVSAPGEFIYTAWAQGIGFKDSEKSYGPFKFTSSAAAIVSGVIAKLKQIKPNIEVNEARLVLQETATDFRIPCDRGENHDECGAGIVNSWSAVKKTMENINV